MSKKNNLSTKKYPEKTILVGVEIFDHPDFSAFFSLDDSLNELEQLSETAGLKIVGQVEQKLDKPNPSTLIGSGKVEELKILKDELDAEIILFDDELSPRHQRELDKALGDSVRVIDRTTLILDIFAQHANTHEGALQVELAQYEYRLPRLTKAWTHLARQAGGSGSASGGSVGLRGPGEKQLEVDRRDINRRINYLKEEIEKVRLHRGRHRIQRKKNNLPVITLVGYTNAGKSTLLNRLTNSKVYVADKLFATLDPTTRKIDLANGIRVLITDTVGFIQKLPTSLVAAFRATLEEVTESDLLIHVVDFTHPNYKEQYLAVKNTLNELGADHIPELLVYNKIDKLANFDHLNFQNLAEPDAIYVSAKKNLGIDDLLNGIQKKLFETYESIEVLLPYQEGNLISLFHSQGIIELEEHKQEGIFIIGKIPLRYLTEFAGFVN